MADTTKKITVEVKAVVDNAIAKINKYVEAVNKAQRAKIDDTSSSAVRQVGNEAEKSAKKINALQSQMVKLKAAVAGAFTVSAILGIGQAALKASANVELLRKGLEFQIGKDDTKKLIRGIQAIGEASAYDTNQLIPMSRAWINMGENAEQAMSRVQRLVDLGSAFGLTADQIEHANLALSQMAAAGKINAQDMMQLTNANIPAWKMLADAMHMSVTEVRELASQGKLTGEAIEALWGAFSEKTQGAATSLASSLMGQTSNIEEAIANSMSVVGDIIREAFDISGILTDVGEVVEGVRAHLMNIKEAAENIGIKQAILNEISSISPAVGFVATAFVNAFNAIKSVISNNIGIIKTFVEAVLLIKGATLVVAGLTAAFGVLHGAITTLSTVHTIFTMMQTGIIGVRTAFLALTAAMNVNPIILALTLVSAALVALYNNWEEISDAVDRAMSKIQNVVASVCESVAGFFDNLKGKVIEVGEGFLDMARSALPSWASSALSIISGFVNKAAALLQWLADFARHVMNRIRQAQSSFGTPTGERRRHSAQPDFAVVTPKPEVPASPSAPSISKGGGGKGGGGGGSKAISEEERAIEALIKKYSDADKMLRNVIKSEIEMANVSLSMLPQSARAEEEVQVKLMSIKAAHDEVMDGYMKELDIAEKISDPTVRDNVIKGIEKQIEAENKLADAKMRQATFEGNLKTNKEETTTLLDRVFGTDDEYERKIRDIQDGVARIFETADYAKASGQVGDYTQDMDLLSKILQLSPDALQAELEAKNETLDAFVERNKERIAEGAKALTESEKNAKTWSDNTVRYATMVGDSMSDAMMSWITGAKSGKEALSDFVSGILKAAAQLLTRWLSLFAIFSIVGEPRLAARNASAAVFGAYDGKVNLSRDGHAMGGYITGAGTGTSDSIPAMLSNGEYVVRAAAVRRIGVPTLSAINRGHFATGGLVGGGYVGGKKLEPSGVAGNLTLQVNALDATDFDNFLNLRGGGERIQNMLYEAERRFAFSMG